MSGSRLARFLPDAVRRQFAYVVWGVGAGVYVLAVFHRTSLGVAGPLAETRFSLSAAQLGTFIMLQLGVYALMQVPTGILVDRFGPRKMLLAATTTMGAAQIAFALVETYPLALLARGLLGCGDAMTYISVLRLAAGWFPARRYPVLTAFTGLLGSIGNLIATLPLTALLASAGWTPTFLVAGGLSLCYALLLLRPATRNGVPAPEVDTADSRVSGKRVFAEVRNAWRVPGGRLGFWVHLTTMTGPVVFSVLWGFPYLTDGLGYSDATASGLLMVFVAVGSAASLVIGIVVGRRPAVRTPIAVGVAVAGLMCWIVLIGWPGGHPPFAAVVPIVVILAVGGPASSVAFLLARDYNPRHRISTATGLVNVGGFAGSVVGVYLVGQILDLVEPDVAHRTVTAFRWAFVAVAVITAIGIHRIITWWLRTRAEILLAVARGEDVPVPVRAHRWELVDAVILAREAEKARAASQVAAAQAEAATGQTTTAPGEASDGPPAVEHTKGRHVTTPDAGLLLVDKPATVTSHDVVGRVRAIFGTRRVGHAGTLDPMATGLLIVALGRATKLLGYVALETKTYTATIRLGEATDTDDADGTVTSRADASGLTRAELDTGIAALTGEIDQVPSRFSAIKVDGRRAYDLARDGKDVQLAARHVTVRRFEIIAAPRRVAATLDVDVRVDCSTGTYVRALARDLGARLGVGGHLTRLRRESIGPFSVTGALDVFPDGVAPRGEPRPPVTEVLRNAAAGHVIGVDAGVRAAFACRTVTDAEATALSFGRSIPRAGIEGTYAALGEAGEFLALLRETAQEAKPVLVWAAR